MANTRDDVDIKEFNEIKKEFETTPSDFIYDPSGSKVYVKTDPEASAHQNPDSVAIYNPSGSEVHIKPEPEASYQENPDSGYIYDPSGSEVYIKTEPEASDHQNPDSGSKIDVKRKSSIIWNFFTPINEIEAKCNLCRNILKYKSSITNLRTHYTRRHPTVKMSSKATMQTPFCNTKRPSNLQQLRVENFNVNQISSFGQVEITPESPESNESMISRPCISQEQDAITQSEEEFHREYTSDIELALDQPQPKLFLPSLYITNKIGFSENKQLDTSLLKLNTHDFQPFSIVEDTGFREFCQKMNPAYDLPSRKTLSRTLLPAKYEEVKLSTQIVVNDAVSITLTTDSWTSVNNDSFLAVTAHFINSNYEIKSVLLDVIRLPEEHTSHNLANELKRVVSEWRVSNKILLAVTDNAANMKKAVTDILQWRHFGCLAHTLNSIVQDGIKPLQNIMDKAKEIVLIFKRSVTATNKLNKYLLKNGKQPKKLLQADPTRWDSEYYMVSRLIELKEEVQAALATISRQDCSILNNVDFDILKEVVEILAPIENVMKIVSGELYVTCSSVIILADGLIDIFKEMSEITAYSPIASKTITLILNGLQERLGDIEKNKTLLLSTFLDPRFKLGFSSQKISDQAKTIALDQLTSLIQNSSPTETFQEQGEPENIESKCGKYNVFRSLEKRNSNFKPVGTHRSRAIVEIQRYLDDEPPLDKNKCPIDWWKRNAHNFPNLIKLFRQKFAVATSVPCERIFSKSGTLLSERRNRLSAKTVKQILFIKMNS